MNHSFDIYVAEKFGIEEAIFVCNFDFWLKKNKANKKNFFEGRYWTYNSVHAFEELFPYMSKRKIRTTIESLKKHGILLSGNFNTNKYDQTKWYAFSDLGDSLTNSRQIDLSKTANDYTDINTDIKNHVSDSAESDVRVSDSVYKAVDYFYLRYKRYTDIMHPDLVAGQYRRVCEDMQSFAENEDVDYETWVRMIDRYFSDKNMKCDFNIRHFATEAIMMNRWRDVT